jgi:hypothetical protein
MRIVIAAYSRDFGAFEVYVEDGDLGRARAVVGEAESFTEDELVQAEEEDAAERERSQQPD